MPAIGDHRTAIKEGLEGVVRALDHTPPELPLPCAIVGFPTQYNPNDTNSDTATMTIPTTIYVPYSSNRAAEDTLEALVTPVIDAIEEVSSSYGCSGARDFGVLENSAGVPIALGCVIDVTVFA